MSSPGPTTTAIWTRGVLVRFPCFFAFWLVLYGPSIIGLPLGALAAAGATWTSLMLLPPGTGQIRFGALIWWSLHFLWNSVVAGVDVARRAFDPRMPLEPGFMTYRCQLPSGLKKSIFCTTASLLPGSLPADQDEDGNLVLHCLDIKQPLQKQMAVEEALLRRVLGEEESK